MYYLALLVLLGEWGYGADLWRFAEQDFDDLGLEKNGPMLR
jgi:hypothetical protein